MRMTELKIILSDTQLPYHDTRAVSAVCNLLADLGPRVAEVHQIGDFFDFTAISRWVDGTAAEDGRLLQKEIDVAERFMTDINKATSARKTRIMGNHDDRLRNYLKTKAKGLQGLRVLEYDRLTLASEYGWATMAEPYTLAPATVSVHGLSVRKWSGYTAHAHLERVPGNVVHGHTHRAGLVYRTLGNTTRWGMEVGCLMDQAKATYLPAGYADWQQAIGVLYIEGKNVWPSLVEVKADRSLMFEGKRYRP
jgi:hypothetical protein